MTRTLTALALVLSIGLAPAMASAEVGAEPSRERSDRSERAGWALILVGATALAVGLTVAAFASADHADWEASRDPVEKATLLQRGESRALLADTSTGLGLAGIAVGSMLVFDFP